MERFMVMAVCRRAVDSFAGVKASMDQTRATNRLILLPLSANFNGSAQLQHFFNSLCGPIWMILVDLKPNMANFFPTV